METPIDWLVVHPVPRPTVFATINYTSQWDVKTETSNANASLVVFEQSFLTLICVAGYSVIWRRGNETEPLYQKRTDNPFLRQKGSYDANSRKYSVRDKYEIPAIDRYETVLKFEHFADSDIGTYWCESIEHPFNNRTTITLEIRNLLDCSTYAQVIQSGFDIVRLQPANYFFYSEAVNFSMTLIYGRANETNASVPILVYPSGKRIPINTAFSSAEMREELEMNSREKPLRLGLYAIEFSVSGTTEQGLYELILSTTLSNGSRITCSTKFHIFLGLDGSDTTSVRVEKISTMSASVLLALGGLYEIRGYYEFADWEDPRIRLQSRYVQSGTDKCKSVDIVATEARGKCGITAVSKFNDQGAHTVKKGIRILLRAIAPCVIKICDGRRIYSLKVSVVNTDSFDFHKPIRLLSSPDGANTTKKHNPDKLRGIARSAFENDDQLDRLYRKGITLQCLVPACYYYDVVWCEDCTEPKSPRLDTDSSSTRSMSTTNDNFTLSQTLLVTFSGKERYSSFSCAGVSRLSMRTVDTIRANFDYPPVPAFAINEQNGTLTVIISKENNGSLVCALSSSSNPRMTWSREGPNGNKRIVKEGYRFDSTDDFETYVASEPGVYYCNASNPAGWASRSFIVKYPPNPYLIYYLSCSMALIVFIVCGVFMWCIRMKLQIVYKHVSDTFQSISTGVRFDRTGFLNDEVRFLEYDRSLEVDRSKFLITSKLLGAGEFGNIYRGELNTDGRESLPVAIKVPKNSLNVYQFFALADELKIMSQIRPHANVLSLLGACTQEIKKRQLFLITDYCENGSLRDYLIKHAPEFEGLEKNTRGQYLGTTGSIDDLLMFAYQAANGMSYLSAERVIHRDLALRNLLLTAKNIVKISDFGMSRQNAPNTTYYKKRFAADVPIPIFWMAVESLAHGHYTKTSDVWSYGVVLWEMFSCGRRPYPDHDPDADFRRWLMAAEDNRMGPPGIACDEIYDLMLLCWKSNPEQRPTFSECKRIVGRMLEQRSPDEYTLMLVSLAEAWLDVNPWNSRRHRSGDLSDGTSHQSGDGEAAPDSEMDAGTTYRSEANQLDNNPFKPAVERNVDGAVEIEMTEMNGVASDYTTATEAGAENSYGTAFEESARGISGDASKALIPLDCEPVNPRLISEASF